MGKTIEEQLKAIQKVMGGPSRWALTMIITFGKYKGNSLGDIAAVDKGYIYWLDKQAWVNGDLKLAVGEILEDK